MTALIIITIVLLGMMVGLDIVCFIAGDDGVGALGFLHIIPEILAIVALALCL